MNYEEKLKRKLHNGLKLSGFTVRSELCAHIIEKYTAEGTDLRDNVQFEDCIRKLCSAFEQQCLADTSIEREHVEKVLRACLESEIGRDESAFYTISAFDFPRLDYNPEKKVYYLSTIKSTVLSGADTKRDLFLDRYRTVLQRTQRFFHKEAVKERHKSQLQTIDFLLTVSHYQLGETFVLGCLLQGSESVWHLEDPSGVIRLDLSDAKYDDGFFVESTFVLVNGSYEDKTLKVSDMVLPPGEAYEDSRVSFGNINYFGGSTLDAPRMSTKLNSILHRNPNESIYFFSDIHLDNPTVFEKLEEFFRTIDEMPPLAFVFMGNFVSKSHGSEMLEVQQRLFRRFGELASQFRLLVDTSQFIFVPGPADPCMLHTVPRHPLPSCIRNELLKYIPKAVFTTNPCRLQYCTREITVFRADILAKLLQGSLHKPDKDTLTANVTHTIISQGHLTPFSLNAMPVHWQFDHTLRLYPLPNLIVVGDNSEPYGRLYKGCHLINPGAFCDSKFQFKAYFPSRDLVDDCIL